MIPEHWHCPSCYKVFPKSEALEGTHPFQIGGSIYGCPQCRAASEEFELVCDEPGCEQIVTSGTPIPGGYRRTCHEHSPY